MCAGQPPFQGNSHPDHSQADRRNEASAGSRAESGRARVARRDDRRAAGQEAGRPLSIGGRSGRSAGVCLGSDANLVGRIAGRLPGGTEAAIHAPPVDDRGPGRRIAGDRPARRDAPAAVSAAAGVVGGTRRSPRRATPERSGRWRSIRRATSWRWAWRTARCGSGTGRSRAWNRRSTLIAASSGRSKFSDDGQFIATSGYDGLLKIWNRSSQEPLMVLQHPNGVRGLAIHAEQSSIPGMPAAACTFGRSTPVSRC